MANTGTVTLPLLEIEATSYRVESEYLGIAMRLNNLAISQYCRYDFDSMVKFGDTYLGAGEEGLFTLEDADTDDGVDIDAIIEFPTTDFGISHQKRLRSIYIGYETEGSLKLTVTNDEGNEREYTLTALKTGNIQHGGEVSVNRDRKSRYLKLKIENVDGCDFSLNMIEAIITILARKPSGS